MTWKNWLISLWVDLKAWYSGAPPRECFCGCGKPEVKVRILVVGGQRYADIDRSTPPICASNKEVR